MRLVKANRSTQHWCVELTQGGAEVGALATAVFAERRPSWSHQAAEFPTSPPFEQIRPFPRIKASWANQYDFRFVEGEADFSGGEKSMRREARSPNAGSATDVPRKIDMLSLMAMSDAFFGRIFHVRGELVPFGTVSLTTYFHADAADLAAEDISRVLAVADANIFHKSYGDQTGAALVAQSDACSRPRRRSRISRRKKAASRPPFHTRISVIPDAPCSERSGIQRS